MNYRSDILDSGLGKRIVLFMMLAGLIPLLVFTVPLYLQSYGILESQAKQSLEDYAKLASGQLFQTLKQAQSQLLRYSITRSTPPDSRDLNYFRSIKHVRSFDESANLHFQVTPELKKKVDNLRRDSKKRVLLTPVYPLEDGATASFITVGPNDGFWVAEMKPSVLWRPLRPSFFGDRDVVLVIDDKERILSSSRRTLFQLFWSLDEYFSKTVPEGRIGQGEGRLEEFGKVFWVSKQLWLKGAFDLEKWRIVIFRHQDAVQSLPVALLKTLGIWFLIALFGLILLSFRFARRLFEPIQQLSEATNQLAAGNWDTSVSVNTGDELETLSDNFNQMKRTIRDTNQQLKWDATHDRLTGLPNRVYVEERLEEIIAFADQRESFTFSVIYFDLDRFKVINDSLGHKAGDELLQSVADRLRDNAINGETVARMGGDEFMVILDSVSGIEETKQEAQQLIDILTEPFNVRDQKIYIDISMGITANHNEYSSPGEIIRDVDTAMFKAKNQDTTDSEYIIFGEMMRSEAQTRLDMETDIKTAIDEEQFELRFQPIVNIGEASLEGVEVLIRWQHPEKGLIYPGDFIPVAEETGTIKPIGKWVLEESFRHQKQWQRQFNDFQCWLSVNLSPKQLYDSEFIHDIDEISRHEGYEPGKMKLEVTENAVMSSKEQAFELLKKLRDRGFQIAMDDFGTGYSSLALLKNIPLDLLKIDREFIEDIHDNNHQKAIVAAVNGIAGQMDLEVIAEGIEQREELDYLSATDCQMAQGFYFARPMTADDVGEILATRESWLEGKFD